MQQGSTWSGVAFGNDTYILNDRSPLISSNGATWQNGGALNFVPWNSRRIFFVPHNGGLLAHSANRIVLLSQSLCVSSDAGETW